MRALPLIKWHMCSCCAPDHQHIFPIRKPSRRYESRLSEDLCKLAFRLRLSGVPAATDPSGGAGGSTDGHLVAAAGTRKHAKAHWSYASCPAFLSQRGAQWSGLGLTAFRATSKAGVESWLQWIVEHTPLVAGSASNDAAPLAAGT